MNATTQLGLKYFSVTSEELGELLVEVEDDVRVSVLARNRVCPQLFHEEDLIRELWRGACG